MHFDVTTPPAREPVDISEVKVLCRIDGSDQDSYLLKLVKAARTQMESDLNRALITQTIKAYCDHFPRGSFLELPQPKLQTVSSIQYYDTNNVLQTFASSNYQTSNVRQPGRIRLNDDSSWPSTYERDDAVVVEYTAGYGDDEDDVPMDIRRAIMAMVCHWHDHPGLVETQPGLVTVAIGKSYNYTVAKYKVSYF